MSTSYKQFDPRSLSKTAIKLTTKPAPIKQQYGPKNLHPDTKARLMSIAEKAGAIKPKPKAVSAPVSTHKKQLANAFKKESPNLPAQTVAFAKIRPAFYN